MSTRKGGYFVFLLPGILFLIVFQLYTMTFTAFSSFTNYGTGHLDDKQAAITAIEGSSVVPVVAPPTRRAPTWRGR